MIVKANAEDLTNSQVTADLSIRFSESERAFLAISLPEDKIEDPGTLELDNALILVYGVAIITSPDDEQALEEHRKYIIKILSNYKRALWEFYKKSCMKQQVSQLINEFFFYVRKLISLIGAKCPLPPVTMIPAAPEGTPPRRFLK